MGNKSSREGIFLLFLGFKVGPAAKRQRDSGHLSDQVGLLTNKISGWKHRSFWGCIDSTFHSFHHDSTTWRTGKKRENRRRIKKGKGIFRRGFSREYERSEGGGKGETNTNDRNDRNKISKGLYLLFQTATISAGEGSGIQLICSNILSTSYIV